MNFSNLSSLSWFQGHIGRIHRKLRKSKIPTADLIFEALEPELSDNEMNEKEENKDSKMNSRKSSVSTLPSVNSSRVQLRYSP